jgi:hypothetical protein
MSLRGAIRAFTPVFDGLWRRSNQVGGFWIASPSARNDEAGGPCGQQLLAMDFGLALVARRE